ncbi:response regulator transcription factor [Candidatus Poriferisodalis sp.]|uniref:response regulator transcription factor n=1 Tax=Candidatus Poriferisodalis sp. TaxID=3101277 RepID=UPI003B58D462
MSETAAKTIGEISNIVTSGGPALDRIESVIHSLRPIIPHVAYQVGIAINGRLHTLVSRGYDDRLLQRFSTREWFAEARDVAGREAVRQCDVSLDAVPTIREYLHPAGFNEGITYVMWSRSGKILGAVNLSCADTQDVTPESCQVVTAIGPAVENLTIESRLQSSAETLYLVHESGSVRLQQGTPDADERWAVERRIAEFGGNYPAGTFMMSVTPGSSATHRLHVVPLSRFGPIPTRAALVLKHAITNELTPREAEVLSLVGRGMSNPEIAEELGITRRTVATHLEHIITRLGVANRTHAAVEAARRGLLSM